MDHHNLYRLDHDFVNNGKKSWMFGLHHVEYICIHLCCQIPLWHLTVELLEYCLGDCQALDFVVSWWEFVNLFWDCTACWISKIAVLISRTDFCPICYGISRLLWHASPAFTVAKTWEKFCAISFSLFFMIVMTCRKEEDGSHFGEVTNVSCYKLLTRFCQLCVWKHD